MAELERRAEQIRDDGGLPEVSMLRDFTPNQRVEARLELSAGGLLRRVEAGLDVMGDGTLVPYSGAIVKRRLEPESGANPFEAVRDALEPMSGGRRA